MATTPTAPTGRAEWASMLQMENEDEFVKFCDERLLPALNLHYSAKRVPPPSNQQIVSTKQAVDIMLQNKNNPKFTTGQDHEIDFPSLDVNHVWAYSIAKVVVAIENSREGFQFSRLGSTTKDQFLMIAGLISWFHQECNGSRRYSKNAGSVDKGTKGQMHKMHQESITDWEGKYKPQWTRLIRAQGGSGAQGDGGAHGGDGAHVGDGAQSGGGAPDGSAQPPDRLTPPQDEQPHRQEIIYKLCRDGAPDDDWKILCYLDEVNDVDTLQDFIHSKTALSRGTYDIVAIEPVHDNGIIHTNREWQDACELHVQTNGGEKELTLRLEPVPVDKRQLNNLPGWRIERTDVEMQALLRAGCRLAATQYTRSEFTDRPIASDLFATARSQETMHLHDGEEQNNPPMEPSMELVQSTLQGNGQVMTDAREAIRLMKSVLKLNDDEVYHLLQTPEYLGDNSYIRPEIMPGRKLKPHQIIFTAWAICQEHIMGGGVLGDDIGTGKTTTFLAFLSWANRRWELLRDVRQHVTRPTAIVVPTNLSEKWLRDCPMLLPRTWKIFRYSKSAKTTVKPYSTTTLDADQPAFDPHHAGEVVVIITFQELGLLKEAQYPQLKGLFDRVVLDESQNIRHWGTTKKSAALSMMQPRFRWCLTATICYNSLSDVRGHVAFLEQPNWCDEYAVFNPVEMQGRQRAKSVEDNQRFSNNKRASDGVDAPFMFNPFDALEAHPEGLHFGRMCLTAAAWDYWIAPHMHLAMKDRGEWDVVTQRLALIFRFSTLTRSYGTKVTDVNGDEITVGDSLPPLKVITVAIRMTSSLQKVYGKHYMKAVSPTDIVGMIDAVQKEIEQGRLSKTKVKATISKGIDSPHLLISHNKSFPLTAALPTHFGLPAFSYYSLQYWQKRRHYNLRNTTQFMMAKGEIEAAQPADLDAQAVEVSDSDWLLRFLSIAPKMVCLLEIIAKEMFDNGNRTPSGQKDKILIFCQWPKSADLVLKLLGWIGLDVVYLDAKMTLASRYATICKFNERESPRVLLTQFSINIASLDCHHRCSVAILVEPAFNQATEMQAAQRVYRFGQTASEVRVYRIYLEKTTNDRQEQRIAKKAAPHYDAMLASRELAEGLHEGAKVAKERGITGTKAIMFALGHVLKDDRKQRQAVRAERRQAAEQNISEDDDSEDDDAVAFIDDTEEDLFANPDDDYVPRRFAR